MKTMKKAMSTESAVKNVEANVAKALGRPTNPESARQKKIVARETKRANGELKRGRPTVTGSKRQAVLAARAAKIAAGGTLSKGRPVNMNSKRQQALAAKAAVKVAAVTETAAVVDFVAPSKKSSSKKK